MKVAVRTILGDDWILLGQIKTPIYLWHTNVPDVTESSFKEVFALVFLPAPCPLNSFSPNLD